MSGLARIGLLLVIILIGTGDSWSAIVPTISSEVVSEEFSTETSQLFSVGKNRRSQVKARPSLQFSQKKEQLNGWPLPGGAISTYHYPVAGYILFRAIII